MRSASPGATIRRTSSAPPERRRSPPTTRRCRRWSASCCARPMRRLIWIAAVVLVLLGLAATAAVVIVDRMDFDQYRPLVAQRAAAALGRPVAITGKLEIKAGWSPWLSVEGLEIGNAPGASRPAMIEVGRVEASLQLLPLL